MDIAELPWLPEPPASFRADVRALSSWLPDAAGIEARRLAGHRLSLVQLQQLGKAVIALARQRRDVVRLRILSNGTADLLVPAVAVTALRHGTWVHSSFAGFDQVATQALDRSSRTNEVRYDFVLLALDHRGLPFTPSPGDEARAIATVGAALEYTDSLRTGLREGSGCTVIVQTVPQTLSQAFGSLDRSLPGTLPWLIERYNHEIRTRVPQSSDLLLDTAALAEAVGLARWHDAGLWNLGKFQFSQHVAPLYAEWLGRLIAAARGASRKCLVLDLDDTIWGGVIGDDGVDGIVIGNGNPAGEAFLSIQRTVLALRERGIVIAVCSKNEDAVARTAFRLHPEMLLKEHHVAVFQANWRDKASNLKEIAAALNLGVDSLVLLDDNPVERAQVRAALPMVAVPELPADAAFFPQFLLAAGYFEATRFTPEDRDRADQYQANARRAGMRTATTDLKSWLLSLDMKVICAAFAPVDRSRITQLINKSNQCNLTTRRYTEAEIVAFERDASGLTVQARLTDRFGDNGIVSIVICRRSGADWLIDTWLMSCRVLNRELEHAVLAYVVAKAHLAGVRALIGEYIATERNGIAREHYSRLGFRQIAASAGSSRWRLDIDSYEAPAFPMELVDLNEEMHA